MAGPGIIDLGKAANAAGSPCDSITDGIAAGNAAERSENPYVHDEAQAFMEQRNHLAEEIQPTAKQRAPDTPFTPSTWTRSPIPPCVMRHPQEFGPASKPCWFRPIRTGAGRAERVPPSRNRV